MAAEVALALVVLIAAGLFLRSFRETRTTIPASGAKGVLLAAYDLTRPRRRRAESAREFAQRLLERLRAVPDVEVAAIATSDAARHPRPAAARRSPLEGRARTDGARDRALSNTVTPGYFAAMAHSASSPGRISPISATRRRRRRRSSTRSSSGAIVDERRGARAPPRESATQPYVDRRRRPQLALRVVRRAADADHLFLVPRSSGARRRDPRAHARRRRDDAGAGDAARRPRRRRGAAGLQRAHDDAARRDEPRSAQHPGADVRRARTARCSCSRRSASTPSWPTPSRSGRWKSACGWRSAPRRARVVGQIVRESLRVDRRGRCAGLAARRAWSTPT